MSDCLLVMTILCRCVTLKCAVKQCSNQAGYLVVFLCLAIVPATDDVMRLHHSDNHKLVVTSSVELWPLVTLSISSPLSWVTATCNLSSAPEDRFEEHLYLLLVPLGHCHVVNNHFSPLMIHHLSHIWRHVGLLLHCWLPFSFGQPQPVCLTCRNCYKSRVGCLNSNLLPCFWSPLRSLVSSQTSTIAPSIPWGQPIIKAFI